MSRRQKKTCLKVLGRVELPATAVIIRKIKFSQQLFKFVIKKNNFIGVTHVSFNYILHLVVTTKKNHRKVQNSLKFHEEGATNSILNSIQTTNLQKASNV